MILSTKIDWQNFYESNESLGTFLAIVTALLMGLLLFFVIRRFLKERIRQKEEQAAYIEGAMTKREIQASIGSYISKSTNPEFSLIKIELDKYDELIENFGKDEADKLVHNMAYHIMDMLPNRVEFSRCEKDQFLIFVKSEYTKNKVVDLAKNLLKLTQTPITIFNDSTIEITASIAIAYYPAHGSNFKQLEESLDIAIYMCKRDGGNQFRIYTTESGDKESENLQYYRQIKNGIKNKEFTLYYQPIIDINNAKPFGCEGLLRWNHPELGVLSPYKFISIMEQSGDIRWVGNWGLECLLKEYQKLKKTNINNEDLILSLNLSPKQLSDETLSVEFNKLLRKVKVPASNISLEISEFTIYDKHDAIRKNITALKNLGFKIAVDGFGLDLNGIKRIEELQIDIVKLDKEYMDPEQDAELKKNFIQMLTSFAQQTGITIIAEGIENEEELAYAKSLGINYVQGYNFSKPISEEEIEEYFQKEDWLNHMGSVTPDDKFSPNPQQE